ncbi:calcium-binding protein [Rhodobacter capsulatus]|uniref:Calcium-binding protein n=1 Tax=Rhodobacter capsulatus TaxID=1061 RepID=A0A4V5PQS5_RHOCA|nr:calcium-binding protein [Rhodobacter capsulatus]TKD15751.1 calcium-binding protein [Rhodobacter capsulatus]
MNRFLKLATMLALCGATLPAVAQPSADPAVVPGQAFLAQWDLDGDGQVTLAEARNHRADIFVMFDSDGDGGFSAEELAGIDDFKQAQLEAGMGPGHQRPDGMMPRAGMGRGMGQGQGQGQGQGMGLGMGQGFFAPAADQMRALDGNGDGRVTQAEFVAGTERWFARRERTGDGVVTLADFGPRGRN